MTDINQVREQFEGRYPVPDGMKWEPTLGVSGDYILSDVRFCSGDRAARYIARWESWQASRQSIVVELPETHTPAPEDDERWHSVRNSTINACRRAIEAQGLKVAP